MRPLAARAAAATARTRARLRGARDRRFRDENEPRFVRYKAMRDVLGALLIVGILFGGLTLASGGTWPPVRVIESHSMMHLEAETHYGRIGTIDVGDAIFVRDVDGPQDVELWVDGGKLHYGRPGDVISFAANGGRAVKIEDEDVANVTVIHRAITWIDVERLADGGTEYRMRWLDGETLTFGDEGIYFPPLGFDERTGYARTNGYRPAHSGFITKGDNPNSNPLPDQALGISAIVHPTWIEGTVHGEVPWLGLAKLALQSGRTNPEVPGWERVGNAFAPIELWSMFFLVLALVILVPLAIDTHRIWRHERERLRQIRLAALEARERKPVEFTPVRRRTP